MIDPFSLALAIEGAAKTVSQIIRIFQSPDGEIVIVDYTRGTSVMNQENAAKAEEWLRRKGFTEGG